MVILCPLRSTRFANLMNDTVSADTPLVWDIPSVRKCYAKMFELVDPITSRCGTRPMFFSEFKAVLDDLVIPQVDWNWGFSAQHVKSWQCSLHEKCVVTIIDKNRCDLACLCPRGCQLRCEEMVPHNPKVSFHVMPQDEVEKRYTSLKSLMAYSVVRIKSFDHHAWGAFSLWPKESSLEFKARPTGSYFCHGMKGVYSLTSKAIHHMIGFVHKGDKDKSV